MMWWMLNDNYCKCKFTCYSSIITLLTTLFSSSCLEEDNSLESDDDFDLPSDNRYNFKKILSSKNYFFLSIGSSQNQLLNTTMVTANFPFMLLLAVDIQLIRWLTLLKPDIPSEHICTVQALAVTQNAVFVVDVDSVNFEDLKADDLGSWTGTGTKKTYFRVLPSGDVRYSVKKPAPLAATQYFLLTRHYFIHKTYNKFHRMITDVRGWQDKFCVCLVILVNVYIVKLFITIA